MKLRRVLVAPLDWGLGHATRCVPIIQELLALECEVYVAGSGQSLLLLNQEFPQLTSFDLPGYNPVYSRSGSLMLKLAMQAGKFVSIMRAEQRMVSQIVANHQIDFIISDNRYGCYAAIVPSIFITHQLKLIASPGWGWLGLFANSVTQHFIKKFNVCWIPDFPDSLLSGELSQAPGIPTKFIGPLSRFKESNGRHEKMYDVLALISGPEPQRSIFEELVTKQIVESGLKALIVRGIVNQKTKRIPDHVEVVDHLNSNDLEKAINQSAVVLTRSGYSTVMDLYTLQKKAMFVPTPGQTEQEYLAKRFTDNGIAYSVDQNSFSLKKALFESEKFSGFQNNNNNNLLTQNLVELVGSTND